MRKLSLELDELKVESFDTVPNGAAREGGTVRAHADAKTLPTGECPFSICPTCQYQCSMPECYPP